LEDFFWVFVYVTFNDATKVPYDVVLNDGINGERWIEEDVKGSDLDLTGVLSWYYVCRKCEDPKILS
jgi:hypothetical protein